MRKKSGLLVCFLAVLLPLGGCRDLRMAAEDSAKLDAGLHAAMSRNDWQGIYDNADPGYRESVSMEKSQTLFSSISRKLGTPTSSKETSWNMNATTSGTYLTVECDTKFAQNASGTETIVWRKSDGGYRLYGYHINSNELISR